MSDIVVTVPMGLWDEWIDEGDLPDEEWGGFESHFWLHPPLPAIRRGDRLYIVAHGKLRGFAPCVGVEQRCRLRPSVGCILRHGAAVAVTIDEPIRGFRGWRHRWWERDLERPFPNWMTP